VEANLITDDRARTHFFQLRRKSLIQSDVCVVGMGPAGLTVASRLAELGRSVTILESGTTRSLPRTRALNAGSHAGVPYVGLEESRSRQVGGTANDWNVFRGRKVGAKYVPLDEHDLRDWPIPWNDTLPYYEKAQQVCGLGPFDYGVEPSARAQRSPFPIENHGLINGVYHFGAADPFTRRIPGELRRSRQVQVLKNCNMIGLGLNRGVSSIAGVRFVDLQRREWLAQSRLVVLACGAVENARRLLLHGLDLPWLGRGFMEHARDFSLTFHPHDRSLFQSAGFYDLHRTDQGSWVIGRLGLSPELMLGLDLPNAAVSIIPYPSRPTQRTAWSRRARSLVRRLRGGEEIRRYGWSSKKIEVDTFEAFRLIVNVEQEPNPSNRISLGSAVDTFGDRLPHLDLSWTPQEQERLERLRDVLVETFRSTGLGAVEGDSTALPDLSAHHHAGTTRMSRDSKGGVVDETCRVFGSENLYVAGGSIFPRAGFANPTLSIVALALRLADHLDSVLG